MAMKRFLLFLGLILPLCLHAANPGVFKGAGSPEGVQVGRVGDFWINTSGGASNTLYTKKTGTATTTGWVAIGGVSDNWTASGSTNSTLAGTASVDSLVVSNTVDAVKYITQIDTGPNAGRAVLARGDQVGTLSGSVGLWYESAGSIYSIGVYEDVGDAFSFAGDTLNVDLVLSLLDFAGDFHTSGFIKTASSGTSAGEWKLGPKVLDATVTLVTTNYVEVMINGAVVKLGIVQ